MKTRKFMQVLDEENYRKMEKLAKGRGTTVQQFLRLIVIPEWFDVVKEKKPE